MATLFDKLNLKAQTEILVIGAPEFLDNEIKTLERVTVFRSVASVKSISFSLAFCFNKAQVDRLSTDIAAKADRDAVLWFAYPKGTSKTLKCDFNRDTGWDVIRGLGFDSVRLVSMDADWSALRFRRVEFINRS